MEIKILARNYMKEKDVLKQTEQGCSQYAWGFKQQAKRKLGSTQSPKKKETGRVKKTGRFGPTETVQEETEPAGRGIKAQGDRFPSFPPSLSLSNFQLSSFSLKKTAFFSGQHMNTGAVVAGPTGRRRRAGKLKQPRIKKNYIFLTSFLLYSSNIISEIATNTHKTLDLALKLKKKCIPSSFFLLHCFRSGSVRFVSVLALLFSSLFRSASRPFHVRFLHCSGFPSVDVCKSDLVLFLPFKFREFDALYGTVEFESVNSDEYGVFTCLNESDLYSMEERFMSLFNVVDGYDDCVFLGKKKLLFLVILHFLCLILKIGKKKRN